MEAFQLAKAKLPLSISERLKCSKHFKTHGSYRTLFLFNVWDTNQNAILDPEHFRYCLGYDPYNLWGKGGDWYFSVWLNTTRPALNRDEIRSVLEKDIPNACPKPFKFKNHGRAVECIYCFDFDKPLLEFPRFIAPFYVKLINALHPILRPIIDTFSVRLSKAERSAAILSRKKEHYSHRPQSDKLAIKEYTRSIPKSWRAKLLVKHGSRCAICQCDLIKSKVHIDYITAFSRGGMAVLENLQPLCPPCNLKKGNRPAQ